MPMGVFIPVHTYIFGMYECQYTQRGFLHCLFGFKGFLRTSNGG